MVAQELINFIFGFKQKRKKNFYGSKNVIKIFTFVEYFSIFGTTKPSSSENPHFLQETALELLQQMNKYFSEHLQFHITKLYRVTCLKIF